MGGDQLFLEIRRIGIDSGKYIMRKPLIDLNAVEVLRQRCRRNINDCHTFSRITDNLPKGLSIDVIRTQRARGVGVRHDLTIGTEPMPCRLKAGEERRPQRHRRKETGWIEDLCGTATIEKTLQNREVTRRGPLSDQGRRGRIETDEQQLP